MRTVLPLLLLSSSAFAGDALTFDAINTVTHGEQVPSVTFHLAVSGSLDVSVTCGTRTWKMSRPVQPGSDQTLSLDGIAEGKHDCAGTILLRVADGSEGEMSFDLPVSSLPGLKLTATLDDLDLTADTLVVHANRPLSESRLSVYGARGALLAEVDADMTDPANPAFSWRDGGQEVVKLVVASRDSANFKSTLDLSPWQYSIPHEDVVFGSGKAEIGPDEVPKLEHSWAEIARTLELYGSVVEIELFVAGYTDTVGDPASNRALSERRARSIGQWFRKRGFTGPIHYQGFGEAVLAVKTGDETAEPANRRALYLLAAQLLPVSEELPSQAWKDL
jgi:outer membrane protein OmpA-like peptidoglycan-associated protein